MKHDAPVVLAVVGVLGLLSVVCMTIGGVLVYSARQVTVVAENPFPGTIVFYRAPRH
jgi:hypothetical protein